ncbi:unnamed protein product [Cylicostephanus goldi]|uniref:Uncharacterized protein n=1 Tax=Cylicostephanus goldi TaxID=71465 RepID=A0A3P7MA18_CYLGO|nr:unnamed protein product [Cylicostephanus goldi]
MLWANRLRVGVGQQMTRAVTLAVAIAAASAAAIAIAVLRTCGGAQVARVWRRHLAQHRVSIRYGELEPTRLAPQT